MSWLRFIATYDFIPQTSCHNPLLAQQPYKLRCILCRPMRRGGQRASAPISGGLNNRSADRSKRRRDCPAGLGAGVNHSAVAGLADYPQL